MLRRNCTCGHNSSSDNKITSCSDRGACSDSSQFVTMSHGLQWPLLILCPFHAIWKHAYLLRSELLRCKDRWFVRSRWSSQVGLSPRRNWQNSRTWSQYHIPASRHVRWSACHHGDTSRLFHSMSRLFHGDEGHILELHLHSALEVILNCHSYTSCCQDIAEECSFGFRSWVFSFFWAGKGSILLSDVSPLVFAILIWTRHLIIKTLWTRLFKRSKNTPPAA